ncbi:hypothetical protein [Caulobacter segnis]
MPYTLEQLSLAYKAVHVGIAPDAATQSLFQAQAILNASGQLADAQLLGNVVNSADNSTALALLSYQFFTGKSPTAAGLAYLVNSTANPTDLNDAYYARFNLENRYINFAANLGVAGEGAIAFSAKYGAMSFGDYVASIYQTIIGDSYAAAADSAKAIADIVSRKQAILATATSAGIINPNMTAAQIDIALKAATAGYLLAEAIKADVGLYAAAANNFMVAMAQGTAVYNTNMVYTYAPVVESASHGTGHAIDRGATLPYPTPDSPTAPTPLSLVLTTGVDNAQGGGGDDTITGTHLTFNGTDVINGGGGNDTLTVNATGGGSYIMPGASVSGVETFNLVNTGDTSANTTSWTGLTKLNATTAGSTVLTTATSTNVVATVNGQAALPVVLNGGKDVSLTANGVTTGTIDIGGTTAPTGAITVNRTAAGSAGQLTITGGTSVDVTQTDGAVTINGSALTTAVKVKTTGTPGAIAITDVNAGAAALGKITSVDLDGYTTASIGDSALTTLKLAHGSGAVNINSTGATSPVTTLNLTLNGVTGGALTDTNNKYTTLNVTTGATASTLANINDSALTTLNLGGASRLTLTATSGMTSLTTINITGAAGLSTGLTPATVTTIDASGSSGANSMTIRPATVHYTGGSGADAITLVINTINSANTLGGGDDSLFLGTSPLGGTGSFSGGSGTDTVSISIIQAQTFSGSGAFATQFTSFEVLRISGALFIGAGYNLDLAVLGNYGSVVIDTLDGNAVLLDNFVSGGNLTLTGDQGGGASITLSNAAFTGGTTDSVNINLSHAGIQTAGDLNISGVETVNLTTQDISASPTGAFLSTLTLHGSGLKILNISGNAGLDLGTLGFAALNTLDASGLTLGGLNVTVGNSASAITIKGSATGANNVVASALTADVTYTGGSGVDTITLSDGHNIVTLGAGNDRVNLQFAPASASNPTTITDFAHGDSISFALVGGAPTAGALGAAITYGGSYTNALDAAAASTTGAATAVAHWFTDGVDTYVVIDASNSNVFVAGSDYVVKLAGVLDLSTATVAGSVLTF